MTQKGDSTSIKKRRRPKRVLTFFEELEALDCEFFDDLERMIEEEEMELERVAAYKVLREENAIRAKRIYPRLKAVEAFDVWENTQHICPDFWGGIRDRVKECKRLYEKRERLRWFLRALYEHWMFDLPLPWPHNNGNRVSYSEVRKFFMVKLKEHKKNVRKKRRVRKERRQTAEEVLARLKQDREFQL